MDENDIMGTQYALCTTPPDTVYYFQPHIRQTQTVLNYSFKNDKIFNTYGQNIKYY